MLYKPYNLINCSHDTGGVSKLLATSKSNIILLRLQVSEILIFLHEVTIGVKPYKYPSPEGTLVLGVHGCTRSTLEGLRKLRGVGDWS